MKYFNRHYNETIYYNKSFFLRKNDPTDKMMIRVYLRLCSTGKYYHKTIGEYRVYSGYKVVKKYEKNL